MNRERKPLFDPKAFLSKVNGGEPFRLPEGSKSHGESADPVFYIQSGKVKKTVVSEQGKEAVVALGYRRFLWGRVLDRQPRRLQPSPP